MSSKVKRKVTVDHGKDSSDHIRRPSVFERLGPGTVNLPSQQPQDRHGRNDQNEKCRNWLRTGSCVYGNTCRYQHDPYPGKRSSKEIDKKDLRHKVQKQHDDESRPSSSSSSKRKNEKHATNSSRKSEHEGTKIKSTVVVTRPRSPPPPAEHPEKEKQKSEGAYEEDSDDWPVDESQLDYKEELTLERKRQQLQRELALELQKERMLSENASVSESSSTSSSSDSGSISSSSDSSSSSSEEDSDNSSSSSSSSSSSTSQVQTKKKLKKESIKTVKPPTRKKPLDDYDKIKISRTAKPSSSNVRIPSPHASEPSKKRGRDKKSPQSSSSSKKYRSHHDTGKTTSSSAHSVPRGPRTPSPPPPPPSQKQRQWGQSSSADSRSADTHKSRSKKHKKKKDSFRSEHHKSDYLPTPPCLSSPNRTVLQQPLSHSQGSKKNSRTKDDTTSKYGHRSRDEYSPPIHHSRVSSSSSSALQSDRHGFSNPDATEKLSKSKYHGHKLDEVPLKKDSGRSSSGNVNKKRSSRMSTTNDSNSPPSLYHDGDQSNRKSYPSQFQEKNRRRSASPSRKSKGHKESMDEFPVKRRDDGHKDGHHRGSGNSYSKKDDHRSKRGNSSDMRKGREDSKLKDRGQKDRLMDEEIWDDDHKKSIRGGRLESQTSSKGERSRDRDRKKGKDCDLPLFKDDLDRDRMRLSPVRVPDLLSHHGSLKDDPPVTSSRGHLYDSELTDDRDYPPFRYGGYVDDRALPTDYDADLLRGPSLYPPPETSDYPPVVYSDTRYQRDIPLKDPVHLDRIVSYGGREVSPLDPPVREDDYLTDLPIDERRSYDERWPRSRPLREEWDTYSPLPQSSLPFHISTDHLDEDRYGMPRRRRSSPDWPLRRGEDRELSLREPRSRSPQHRRNLDDPTISNRTSWRDQSDRRDGRIDNRTDNQQKSHDDRKNRTSRRDRRDGDRNARSIESPIVDSTSTKSSQQTSTKEKNSSKRSRSSTPIKKDAKKRREDNSSSTKESSSAHDKTSRKSKDSSKDEVKSHSSSSKTSSKTSKKTKSISPKPDDKPQPSDKAPSSRSSDKSESGTATSKSGAKSSTKNETDEKKKRNNDGKLQAEDEFSDWSEGDDDLLNRDVNEVESSNAEIKSKNEDSKKEKEKSSSDKSSKQKRDGSRDSRSRISELKSESRSRPVSKERDNSECSRKNEGSVPSAKESDSSEAFVIKDEDVDIDAFAMTESVDYDPISDEELETMIEEPQDSLLSKPESNDEMKVIDALDVNWSDLVTANQQPKFIPGNARKRFKAAHVLARIGFSKAFAGSEMTQKINKFCQQQLDEETEEQLKTNDSSKSTDSEKQVFRMEHNVPAFHVSLVEQKRQRLNAFKDVGSNRRALCARQDLHMRKLLCRPFHKLVMPSAGACLQQFNNVDAEPELNKLEIHQPPIINSTC